MWTKESDGAPKICVVEDEESIRELVLYALRGAGFDAEGFEKGADFWSEMERKSALPALVLLDIMLPEENGLSILRRLRKSSRYATLPVIMLTAKDSEYDKVKGLDAGADDYVAKPFGVTELISRINAVLRRSARATDACGELVYGSVRIDDARRAVWVDDEKKPLTFREYELLRYLLLNAGLALGREKITEAVWGYDYIGATRTVDMHIKTLRRKLGTAGRLIETVRGVGYRLGE